MLIKNPIIYIIYIIYIYSVDPDKMLQTYFVLTKSVDPDEMQGLHCLSKYSFMCHRYTNGSLYIFCCPVMLDALC